MPTCKKALEFIARCVWAGLWFPIDWVPEGHKERSSCLFRVFLNKSMSEIRHSLRELTTSFVIPFTPYSVF